MISKIKKYLVFTLLIGFFSCKTVEYVTVAEYKPSSAPTTSSFYYALPRTTFKVDIEFVRTTRIPGPYYNYAERYLSIENALTKDSVSWKISDLSISSSNEADPNHYYVVESSAKDISYNNLFQMSEEGLIIDLSAQKSGLYSAKYIENKASMETPFKDLSVVENFGTVKDTLYRLVFRDTAFVKTPLIKYQVEQKSVDKKANEAALFIFELREKRFELITGNSENVPEGSAMKASLDEISRLEEEYLSLFVGKSQTDTFKFSYEVTPEGDRDMTRQTLFRFSEKDGVTPESLPQGTSFVVEVTKGEANTTMVPASGQEPVRNKVFYRAAEPGTIRLLLGNKLLSTSRANVYQYGKIITLPISVTIQNKEE